MDTTVTPALPPLAPDIAAMLQCKPEPKNSLPSRDQSLAEFHARVKRFASREVPGHVLALADRLCFESRVPFVVEVTNHTLLGVVMDFGRHIADAEHILATICNLRGLPWAAGAGRDLRKLCDRLRDVLACIDDQTHAAEDESDQARAVAHEAKPLSSSG